MAYLDRGEHLSTAFLVMELAIGSLRDRLDALGRLAVADAIAVAQRIAGGLAWIHSQNCVHRDIKPANILETRRGWVLGDMGIVKWGDMNPSFTGAGTITKTAVQLGSWYYMAPEQYESPHDATPASDVYAFGVTLIEMMVGQPPTPSVVAAGRVPPPSGHAAIDAMIRRMTAFDPGERPSVAEVQRTLGDAVRATANG
ncbi:Hypothetical protein I5071_55970 [Sandaracinus amylolyticus]|nr:Hypothetical protein I5071_55970 [Sandaracinus amylolyticus]